MFTVPPSRPLVAASILAADFGHIADEIQDVLGKGADLVHVDIMDGHFVPNLTMGPDMVKGIRRQFPDLFIDVHLMVERPDLFVDAFAKAGANNFSFQLEICRPMRQEGVDAAALIERIHKLGMSAGMVINPPTPPEGLVTYLDRLDLVLVMSVHPGLGGQAFMPEVLEKVRWLKPQLRSQTRLEMDGGLNPHTAPQAVTDGVEVLVTGSALFGAADRAEVIRQLHGA